MYQRILRFPEAINTIGLSRSSIYLRINKGTFPKPIKIGERAIGWPSGVIEDWMDDQIQKSIQGG
jgi:prophage regulatory protein